MFCDHCDVVICYKCMYDTSHRNHDISDLPEKFNAAKGKIWEWKSSLASLQSLVSFQEKEIDEIKCTSVEKLSKFMNAVLKELKKGIDKYLDNYRQALSEVETVRDKVAEMNK